jgi:glycosyltransferase involved in cell wall biosynthesis
MQRRVAHILRKYNPDEWGGTETHVVEVTRRLGHVGWAAEVHAPAGPVATDRALSADVRLVRYRSFSPFLGSAERRRALVANAGNIASFHEPYLLWRDRGLTLAHLHTQGRVGGGVRTAMRLTGRPYVVSVHGPLFAEPALVASETRRRLTGIVDLGRPIGALFGARRVIGDAARVIAFNERERQALAERIGTRAVRMDHGVDAARLASGDPTRARSRWPELANAPVLALVGRLCRQKNQVLAVKAFARGAPPDHHLVFAGAATDHGYREKIDEEIRAQGVGARVHVLGNLDGQRDVPDLFALARLIIVPSTHEAFGLAVLEGWAANRPVLFANRSGLADLAGALDDEGVSLSTLDVDEWAAALERLLLDESRLQSAASRGNRLVRTRYDWDSVARELATLYDQVVAEHGHG